MNKRKGYIHLYTGNGKGKTSAATGLAIRAAGACHKIYFAVFVKGMEYSEYRILKGIPNINVHIFGRNCFIKNTPEQEDIDLATHGMELVTDVIKNNSADIIVMDEICIALHYELINEDDLIKLILGRPYEMEVVLTGRYATDKLFDIADLVTNMTEIKHYYNKGIQSREGIDF